MNQNEETDYREWIESKYLAGWEVKKAGGMIVTIKDIEKKMVFNPKAGKELESVVMHLEDSKPIILNKINRKSMAAALKTTVMQKWIGQKVELYTEWGKWFGDKVGTDAIRIKTTAPAQAKKEKAPLPILKSGTKQWEGAEKFVSDNAKSMSFDDIMNKISGSYRISAASKKALKGVYDGV